MITYKNVLEGFLNVLEGFLVLILVTIAFISFYYLIIDFI
jgi:hypothetical protein